MKWIAISGSWMKSAPTIESDVRNAVREIILAGDGIVTGGALGVDYFATDEYMKNEPTASRLKIFLPATLERYVAHYRKRATEGVITSDQAEMLIEQLEGVAKANPAAIIAHPTNTVIDKTAYFDRITDIVNAADGLRAFQINGSLGTQDTIDKAHKKGIPVEVFSYTV